ncbi:MAG TPA: ferredoxin [Streptosporangiaceae bacterium]|nr:ferredoxin [Streptosporangiaceae bacterium]
MTAPAARRPAVEVDHDLCAGASMCLQYAPNAFRLNASGQSVFDPDGDWRPDEVADAIEGCPMAAIRQLGPAGPAR